MKIAKNVKTKIKIHVYNVLMKQNSFKTIGVLKNVEWVFLISIKNAKNVIPPAKLAPKVLEIFAYLAKIKIIY